MTDFEKKDDFANEKKIDESKENIPNGSQHQNNEFQNNSFQNSGYQHNANYPPNGYYPPPSQYYPQNANTISNGAMQPNGYSGPIPPNMSAGHPYQNGYTNQSMNGQPPVQNYPNIPYNPANFQAGPYPNAPGGYIQNNESNNRLNMSGQNHSEKANKAKEDPYDDLKTSSFYNERYKNPGKGRLKGILAPLLIVALLSSILGGAITGVWFQFFYNQSGSETAQIASGTGTETVRRVEIVDKTDSPITAISEKAGPSVVGINVEYSYNDSFFGAQNDVGQGSGIIISSDGYILTNNHVVEAAANTGVSGSRFSNKGKITVILPNQKDKPYEATIIGTDAKTDIAVIKIEATGLPVAEMGDSDALKVGELAVAIGNPAGLEYMGSVTSGIISGLNRQVDTGDGKMLKLIQTDAAISPGNSGGALLNSKGQVIGVNSSKIGGTSFEGLGFAIPIKDAMSIANTLKTDGFVTRPQIGVSIDNSFTAEIAKANKVPEGVLVADVMVASSADKAGVKTGDIITKFNNEKVTSFDELEEQKNLFKPGDKVSMEVYRIPEGAKSDAGTYVKIEMTLGSTADKAQ